MRFSPPTTPQARHCQNVAFNIHSGPQDPQAPMEPTVITMTELRKQMGAKADGCEQGSGAGAGQAGSGGVVEGGRRWQGGKGS